MTLRVKQLLEELQDYDEDTEVRLILRGRHPTQSHLQRRIEAYEDDSRTLVLYLAEGEQVYDTPYAPMDVVAGFGME